MDAHGFRDQIVASVLTVVWPGFRIAVYQANVTQRGVTVGLLEATGHFIRLRYGTRTFF